MKVHPTAIAAATLKPKKIGEPFHAPIPAHTPIGSYCTIYAGMSKFRTQDVRKTTNLVGALRLRVLLARNLVRPPSIVCDTLVTIFQTTFPYTIHLKVSTSIPYTIFVTVSGCPIHLDSHGAKLSTFFSTRSANLFMTLVRCWAVHVDHSPLNAARAAATAASTSAWPATWMLSATRDSS